jgi:hypothetical protein
MQHAFRMTEEKTRRGLEGKFFPDWQESVGNLRGWNDGGRFFTNYIAHPLQGSTTSRIFINNSDSANRQVFGRSKTYWTSRLKSMAWSAIWSLQFEIGPISEASLGNVGKEFQKNGKSKLTYLDIVITPTLGTALTIGEDAIDRYVLARWFERKFRNRLAMKITRSVFTPTTSVANMLRMHAPWWRDFRPN